MDGSPTPLIVGVVLLLVIGGLTLRFYWLVADPWLRRLLGRVLGINIYLGEQSIWQIENRSVDNMDWRNIFIRPLQLLAMMTAGLVPVVVVIILLSLLAE